MSSPDCTSLAAYKLPATLVGMVRRNTLASLPDDGMLEMFGQLTTYERKAPMGLALAGTLMSDAERAGWEYGGSVLLARDISTLKNLRDRRAHSIFNRAGFALDCTQALKDWLELSCHILGTNSKSNARAREWREIPAQPDEHEHIKALREQPPAAEIVELATVEGNLGDEAFNGLLGFRGNFTPTRAHPGVGYLAVLPHEQRAAERELVSKFEELAKCDVLPGIAGAQIKRGPQRQLNLGLVAA